MSKYSRTHKNLVLRIYAEVFKGDVTKTARYAQIPQRTLRDWIYAAQRSAAVSRTAAKTPLPPVQRRF